MSYKTLKIAKYTNQVDPDQEYHKRFAGYGTIHTGMTPVLIDRRGQTSKGDELFAVPLVSIQLLSQTVVDHSRKISALVADLPPLAQSHFYLDQLYESIISSNRIEGVKTTRRELSEAYHLLGSARRKRLKSTVSMYNDIVQGSELTIDSPAAVRAIYDRITEGEIDPADLPDGELFRKGFVRTADEATNRTEHVPPASEDQVTAMLRTWVTFINNSAVPTLPKAFLAHYFFENVHPFYDGNGRTGRYILARYVAKKLDVYSGLVLSQRINEEKQKYYKAFKTTGDVDNRAEGTFFVETMLTLLAAGQEELIDSLTEKKAMLAGYQEQLAQSGKTQEEQALLFLLFQSALFNSSENDELTDNQLIDTLYPRFKKAALTRALAKLEAAGEIELVAKHPKKHRLVE